MEPINNCNIVELYYPPPHPSILLFNSLQKSRTFKPIRKTFFLHFKEAAASNQATRPGASGGNSIPSAAPPNPFLRAVPIAPKKENSSMGVSKAAGDGIQTSSLNSRAHSNNAGNSKSDHSSAFYNSNNSNRGVSVFNSK